jgi:hypothetical protein
MRAFLKCRVILGGAPGYDAPIEEIRSDMRSIYEELAPCDVVMADIQAQTPTSA